MSNEEHGLWLRLGAEHLEGILRLAEGIKNTSQIGIGVIAALMIEGAPLASADELSLSPIHHAISIGQRQGCCQLGLFAPATGGAVNVVVGIPVVYILAPLAGEDAFVGIVFTLPHIIDPVVKHIVMLLDTC